MWQYDYVCHYSSPYYDPEKAHQYYEEHKKLKGRRSTKGMTDTGKEAAAYVSNQIGEEKRAKIQEENERHKKEMELLRDASSRTMEQHRMIMNQRITSLQNLLKRMPESQKHEQSARFKALIYKLKEDNEKKRADIKSKYQTDAQKEAEKHKTTAESIKNEYTSKLEEELDKIAGGN